MPTHDDRGEPTRTAVVAGWIGSTNLGDELLAVALSRRLRVRGVEPLAISMDSQSTRRDLGIDSVGHRDVRASWAALRAASALFLGGGGLLQDSSSHLNIPYHLARPWFATRIGVPFAGVGLGAGPLRTRPARSLIRRVLRRALAIGVRDEDSADLLRSLGLDVTVAADLALSLPIPDRPVEERVVVSLRPPVYGGLRPASSRSHEQPDAWLLAAARSLDSLAGRTGLTIGFLAMQTDRDGTLHERIGERMEADHEHISADVHSVLAHLASARLVVAMRYHAGIGALMGARPAVMLGYSPKVESLVAEVGAGFTAVAADIGGFDAVATAAERVLGEAVALPDGRARLRERERRNDDVIDRALGSTARRAP